MTCHLHRFWWWLGLGFSPTYLHPIDSMFFRFQGTFFRFHVTIFRGGTAIFSFGKGELSRLGLGLGRLFSMQVGGVLEQYRHFASSTSDGGWLGSTLRLSKLQWSSPLRLIQTNVGVDKNPWQKCVKYIIYAFFEGKEHQYNLHTSSTVKQCVGRTQ